MEPNQADKALLQRVACASFYNAYMKLLHIEAHLIGHILEPEVRMNDIVVEHNILEEAKQKVVLAYLPFSIEGRSRDVNKQEG